MRAYRLDEGEYCQNMTHVIEDLQMNLRRRRIFVGILSLTLRVLQDSCPRREILWMRSSVSQINDLVAQNFCVAANDVQGRQVSQRALHNR